jgi:septation ring formation regulator EzrA
MTAQPITLDDISQSIANLSNRFGGLESRLEKVEERLTDVQTGQREVVKRLSAVEGETKALHNDVVELYGLVPS